MKKGSHNSENNIDLKNKTPKIISYEKITPLENEIKHFVKIINGANSNFSGIEKGMDVVKILEMASNSLKGNLLIMKNKNFFVHKTSIIDENVIIGDNTKVWHFSPFNQMLRLARGARLAKMLILQIT